MLLHLVCERRLHPNFAQSTACVVDFIALKDGILTFLFLHFLKTSLALPCSCASLLVPYLFPRDGPLLILKADVVESLKF